ncbi:DUF674 family protein [Senna tora]|uniref:DUF674 family protein n=1 Tax=Senna tora TaxID=362788 RepID=A0A834SX65_9FABA|nr:DUF674 family protein [Senna tora]
MSSSSSKVSLKLLVDTKAEKVLFAEASKDFIDFLFNLLRLPIGTVIRLLTKNHMVGCLPKLYESIENLNDSYFLNPTQHKEALLNPRAPISSFLLQLPSNDKGHFDGGGDDNNKSWPLKLYMCPSRCNYNVTDVMNTVCPNCRYSMNYAVPYIKGKKAEEEVKKDCGGDDGGFVKEVVTYMVMDDLVVQPMSAISSITLLNKFHVKEVGALEEMVVELGVEEGIKLLKASLVSKHVLTSVFLKNVWEFMEAKRSRKRQNVST